MWKIYLHQLSKKSFKKDTGFFTLEILVSLLIALSFVMVSLQSMVYATMLRVQAQARQRGNQLIQEEIERVNVLASNITNTDGECDAANYVDGLAQALWDDVQSYTNPPTNSNPPPIKYLFQKTQADGSIDESGRQFGLNRTHVTNGSIPPHRTLRIRYNVREWDGSQFVGDSIAETYIEVIPDVALSCP